MYYSTDERMIKNQSTVFAITDKGVQTNPYMDDTPWVDGQQTYRYTEGGI